MNRSIDFVVDHPPQFLWKRLSPFAAPALPEEIPAAPEVPVDMPERLIIGPLNYSGQGYLWANALATMRPESWVHSFAISVPGGYSFPIDTEVPLHVHASSQTWQKAQLEALSKASHVLIEAERPLLGRYFKDFEAEAKELRALGVNVAFLAHGTDIRVPSMNREATPWSVYHEPDFYSGREETVAKRNLTALRRLGGPYFVSTPDLLIYLPEATWCPVMVDIDRWQAPERVGQRERPVVVHAPSIARTKGTDLIEPTLHRMHESGLIEYRPLKGIPASQMPEEYGAADIVLDQFRVGSYGVAACEAMSSGRVVLGHVTDQVREYVRQTSELELPIVETTALTLETVLRELIADRNRMSGLGKAGMHFVREVHDGRKSVQVLTEEWLDLPIEKSAW
ncbi:MAG: hypothetical protein ACTIJ6_01615 [Leucobacter sp.]